MSRVRVGALWATAGLALLSAAAKLMLGVGAATPVELSMTLAEQPSPTPAPSHPRPPLRSADSSAEIPAPESDVAAPQSIAARLPTPGPGSDAVALAHGMIDRLSRDELVENLSEITGRAPEELDAIDDLHAFARSLAKALLANELPTPETDTPIQEIAFSRRLGSDVSAQSDVTLFPASSNRIFGSFPLEPGEDLWVIAKWYQVDPPQFLMLEEVPVREQDGQGFVRIDRSDGWPEGLYRLELYASDESVEPVAAGEYRTQGETAPLLAVFD